MFGCYQSNPGRLRAFACLQHICPTAVSSLYLWAWGLTVGDSAQLGPFSGVGSQPLALGCDSLSALRVAPGSVK